MVQQLAAAAEEDGLTHPDVIHLANVGSRGLHVSNVRRDIVRSNFKDMLAPKAMVMEIELHDKNNAPEKFNQLVLPPLNILQTMCDLSPALVPKIFGGTL